MHFLRRPPLYKRIAAVTVSVALVWTAIPIAASEKRVESHAGPGPTNRLAAPVSLKRPAAAEIAQLRQTVESLLASGDKDIVRNAQRLIPWLRVAEASTPSERHEAVKLFAVTIVVSRPANGRQGILKTFIANGKARTQRFVPDAEIGSVEEEPDGQRGGPRVETLRVTTGRWKIGGSGACYWDAYDEGADQCSPVSGRWKVNGSACYFDDTDSGPDQCDPLAGRWVVDGESCVWNETATGEHECSPPSQYCYTDGQIDDCPTQQELDDAGVALAAAQAEIELMESQHETESAAFCNTYPQECGGAEYGLMSGPAGDDSCWAKKQAAIAGTAAAAAAVVAAIGLYLMAPTLGSSGVIAVIVLAGIMVVLAAALVTVAILCYWNFWVPSPIMIPSRSSFVDFQLARLNGYNFAVKPS